MIRILPDNGGDKMLYGAKVLGSYVGSEESIANRLEKSDCVEEGGRRNNYGGLASDTILTASLVLLPKDHSPPADYPA